MHPLQRLEYRVKSCAIRGILFSMTSLNTKTLFLYISQFFLSICCRKTTYFAGVPDVDMAICMPDHNTDTGPDFSAFTSTKYQGHGKNKFHQDCAGFWFVLRRVQGNTYVYNLHTTKKTSQKTRRWGNLFLRGPLYTRQLSICI